MHRLTASMPGSDAESGVVDAAPGHRRERPAHRLEDRIQGLGEMADRVRAYAWETTPLGPIAGWSGTLVAMVNLVLCSPIASVIHWTSEMLMIYNDAYAGILGARHPAALGESASLVWAEIWETIGPQYQGVMATGQPLLRENVLLPIEAEGRLQNFYWIYMLTPVYEDGKVLGLYNTGLNTTESTLATHRFRQSETRSARILQSIGDAVIVTDPETRVTVMNPVAEQLTGWRAEEALGRPLKEVFRLVHQGSREPVASPAEEGRQGNAAMTLGSPRLLIARDGSETYVDDRATPIRDNADQLTGIVLVFRDINERHEAELEREVVVEARRRNEARLKLATEAAELGIFEWHVDGDRISWENERIYQIFGRTPEDGPINGEEFHNRTLLPEYREAHTQADRDAAAGKRYFLQARFYRKDGSVGWVELTGRMEVAPDGSPWRMLGTALDITPRKEAEEAMRASEARYRVLAELSPQALWSATPEGLVTYANRTFLEYIGKDFVPRTGTEYISCFDEQDRERVVSVWMHSVHTGEDYVIDARLIRAEDQASRWWHLRALPVRDDQGRILQWLGTATDVHDSRVTAERLQAQFAEIDRQRRELEAIYRGAPLGMALYEPKELRLIRLNDRQAESLGLTAAEALGKRFDELAGEISSVKQVVRRAAAGESILNYAAEGVLPQRPGEYRYWNANYTPIFADDGSVQAIAGATIEVTTQKRAEAALLQSEKLAAVGRLAASIAHEINNPLEAVTNLLYLARGSGNLDEVQGYLELAERELRRVSVITSQTLRFHKQATNPRAVTCSDLFESVVSVHQGRIVNSRVEIEERLRAGKPLVCFDGEIRQVLNNLVGNAIDAMHPGGGRLLLRSRETTCWETGRLGVVLTVADTGPGIGAAVLKRMFEPFFTTKGIGGTGLGLWISQEIVARHDGRLRARSSEKPGASGAVFTLFLPYEAASR